MVYPVKLVFSKKTPIIRITTKDGDRSYRNTSGNTNPKASSSAATLPMSKTLSDDELGKLNIGTFKFQIIAVEWEQGASSSYNQSLM